MVTFLDTNVLIDVLSDDPNTSGPCIQRLEEAKGRGRVVITDVVLAELSVTYNSVEEINEVVQSLDVDRIRCPDQGLFRAGRAFTDYKNKNAGPKLNVLPDFIIGAHAAVSGAPLVTSDVKRMSGYFPELEVIKP